MGGYPDGTFRPDEAIDRAAVARIVNGVLDRQADEEFVDSHEVISFTDLSEEHWAYYEIMEAVNAHEYVVEDGAEIWQSLK